VIHRISAGKRADQLVGGGWNAPHGPYRAQYAGDAPEQFVHDIHGVMLSYFHAHRLLNEPAAETRIRRAFVTLINAARR